MSARCPSVASAVFLVLLLLHRGARGAEPTPVIIRAIAEALELRSGSSSGVRILDVVQCSLVIPESRCSAAAPYWLSAKTQLAFANAPLSVKSNLVISFFSGGDAGPQACSTADSQSDNFLDTSNGVYLLTKSILFVLWMVDPTCYDFYYIREGRVVVVPPPSGVLAARVPLQGDRGGDDSYLPAGVKRKDLGILYRREALQLLMLSRVAGRLAHEHALGARGEPSLLGEAVQAEHEGDRRTLPPALWHLEGTGRRLNGDQLKHLWWEVREGAHVRSRQKAGIPKPR